MTLPVIGWNGHLTAHFGDWSNDVASNDNNDSFGGGFEDGGSEPLSHTSIIT